MEVLIVCTLMWALVIVLLVFRRARKERSVLYAAVTIAITMMLNDDDLYLVVDGWFGHRDIIHLVSAITLMLGIYWLAQGISKAGVQRWLRGVPSQIILFTAIALTTVGFWLVPHKGVTSTSFMGEYGTTMGAHIYTSATYLYIGFVMTAMGATAVQTLRLPDRKPREKTAALLLLLGSLAGLALSIDSVMMSVASMKGWESFATMKTLFYVLQVLTFAFLTIGLAAAPIARWVAETRRNREVESYLDKVEPLWEAATAARPSPQLERPAIHAEHRLHRRIVEVRDAAMDRSNDFTLSDADKALLAEAEGQLLAGTR